MMKNSENENASVRAKASSRPSSPTSRLHGGPSDSPRVRINAMPALNSVLARRSTTTTTATERSRALLRTKIEMMPRWRAGSACVS
jgi:hypothetical protein